MNLKKEERKGTFFILITAFISGFSIFINKFGVSGIDPYLFAGLKNTLVALFLFSLLLATKEIRILKKLSIRQWLTLFLIGFTGGSLPFLLFFKGLSLTSAIQASFIHKNMFLVVALLAPLLLKEKLDKNFFMASLFLLLGNVLLMSKALFFSLDKGSILVFAATFFWALENIISKKALKSLPAKVVAWGRMFFGCLLIILFLTLTGRLEFILSLQSAHWLWTLVTSLFLFGYVFSWYSGLKHLRVSVATSILTLGAPITSVLSILSGKVLSGREVTGVVLLFAGVIFLVEFRRFKDVTYARRS